MLYEMTGTVKLVQDLVTFPSGFTKRTFVLNPEGEKFPKDVAMSFTKERCSILDSVKPGERVKVTFGINGREWNGKYFVDLDAFKLEKMDESGSTEIEPDFPADVGVPVVDQSDDMPF